MSFGIKLGPARIRVGKRGLGGSIGGRHLRVGRSTNGRSYVSGGAGPFSFMKFFGSKPKRRRRR